MSSICGFLVAIILILGLPISVIWLIVFAIKKKKIKAPLISIASCVVAMIVFTVIGTVSWTKTDDYQEYLAEKAKEDSERAEQEKQKEELERLQEHESSEKAKQEESTTESLVEKTEQRNLDVDSKEETNSERQVLEAEKTTTDTEKNGQENGIDASEMPEEEYKSMCEELWHDDIFFSEDSLEGKYVKLDLFVEEARYFKEEALYIESVSNIIEEYNLCRDFFYCGVQRESEYSYIGGQISLYFSDDYDVSPSDISTGDHLIVYGEIIDYSKDYYDGYNDCHIVAKYIENNGQ